jgi:cytosine/adenosine deaminase-related metal-dependent hydrolase
LLGPGLSVAHGVWLEDAELAELADAKVGVVHCPTSNAGLEVGAARVRAWWDAGLVPALATDSHPRNGRLDIFAEMRCALTTAEGVGAPLSPTEVLSMATIGGAAAVGRGDDLGEIAVGYAADMVTLDLPTGHVTGADVLAEAVVEAGPNRVAQVHVAGRRVVHDGQLMAADETSAAEHRLLLQLRADADARRRRQEAATVLDARVLHALHRAGVPVGVGVRS